MSSSYSPGGFTPNRPSPRRHIKRSSLSKSLTPAEQDRQARGRNPYREDEDDDFSDEFEFSGQAHDYKKYDIYGEPTYETLQLRREAAVILDTPELIMMHAQARGDSITGTRHYFMRQLCGYQEEGDLYSEASTKRFMEGGNGKEKDGGGNGKGKGGFAHFERAREREVERLKGLRRRGDELEGFGGGEEGSAGLSGGAGEGSGSGEIGGV